MEKRRADANETLLSRHRMTQRQREERRSRKGLPKPKTDKNRDGETNNHYTAQRTRDIGHSLPESTTKQEKTLRDSLPNRR